jgi:chromosomal replication initiation ATPase DnaA
MVQLTLNLHCGTSFGRSDFVVSDSNAAAMAWIERWPDWPAPPLVMHGPPGCGKTHLAHLWCERASAVLLTGAALDEGEVAQLVARHSCRVVIDSADETPELALLHTYNWCWECRGSLLIIGRRPPAHWRFALDDLGSRLRAAQTVEIGRPDDALLRGLLVKHFADRQLSVSPEVIAFLIRRIERSSASAAEIAARLDAAALREKSPVTIALARAVLPQNEYWPDERSDGDARPRSKFDADQSE